MTQLAESKVDAETLASELSGHIQDEPRTETLASASENEWAQAQEMEREETRLSREQLGEIAEAVEMMAADSPVAKEKEEMACLEAERTAHREEIEEAKGMSSTVSMLDSRVQRMMSNLKAEIEDTETTIGEAFHALDLDGDGEVSCEELEKAMEHLHLSKRPDATAFQELLDTIDTDHDGKISVRDFRKLIKEMSSPGDDDDDDDDDELPSLPLNATVSAA